MLTDASSLSLYVHIDLKTLILLSIIFSVKLRSISGAGKVDSAIILDFLEHPKVVKSRLE